MISLSEFHSYVSDHQSNICQVTVIQNGKTIINDVWNGYKADDTEYIRCLLRKVLFLYWSALPLNRD